MNDVTEILLSERLGQILSDERKKSGLSFRDVEKCTGINKSTLCYMESGKRPQKATTLIRRLNFYRHTYEKKTC